MKAHQLTEEHVPALERFASAELDAFVMDPEDARLHLRLAHRLRPFLRSVGFSHQQAVSRPIVGRLLRLSGVPDGMTKAHGASIADFADNAWKATRG